MPADRPRPTSPISLDSLQVVERLPAGKSFRRDDHVDSFAMEDPPSEEVRLDPRFHRLAEPATELIDREAMRQLADAEDFLAGPPPHPDEVTRPGIELSAPMPLDRPSVLFHPGTLGPLTQRGDLPTERVARLPDLPDAGEITVPSPIGPPWEEIGGVGSAELTLPAPEAPSPAESPASPDEVLVDLAAVGPGTDEVPLLPDEPREARPAEPGRGEARGAEPGQREAREEPEIAPAPPPPRRTPRPAEPRPEGRSRTDAPADPRANIPVMGMVAILGSGGVLAAGAAAALLAGALVLFLMSGNADPNAAAPLPPIEVAPVTEPAPADVAPAGDPAEVEPEPGSEATPSGHHGSSSSRSRARPAPVAPEPVAVAPEPEPEPVELPPEDLDLDVPAPEPEKKGLFGKKKR